MLEYSLIGDLMDVGLSEDTKEKQLVEEISLDMRLLNSFGSRVSIIISGLRASPCKSLAGRGEPP